jgi:hypothetical protein
VFLKRAVFGRNVDSLVGGNTVKIPTTGNPLPVQSKKTTITDALNLRPKILPASG